ncbi:MAG: nuclear transport factor 2 family protein [Halovenus sp.]
MERARQNHIEKARIRELRANYGRAVDNANWERYANQFTRDGVIKLPWDVIERRENILKYGREEIEYEWSVHMALMPLLEIENDVGVGDWHSLIVYRAPDGSEGILVGSYEDEYVKKDGNWKIKKMKVSLHYDTSGYHFDEKY